MVLYTFDKVATAGGATALVDQATRIYELLSPVRQSP